MDSSATVTPIHPKLQVEIQHKKFVRHSMNSKPLDRRILHLIILSWVNISDDNNNNINNGNILWRFNHMLHATLFIACNLTLFVYLNQKSFKSICINL